MLHLSCHCGAARLTVDSPPAELTNCNCSICRRLAGLWGYYLHAQVHWLSPPDAVESYIQGDRTLRTLRCRTCGCTMSSEPLEPDRYPRMGVNMRNADPAELGTPRIRLLDGADTWNACYWEDLPTQDR